jgi:undecaprenyl-diphosphatase
LEAWQAVILGLVEGITEYLPVSSTGHLILASSLLGLDEPGQKAAVDSFNIVIQGGAIAAVALLYWTRVLAMLRGLAGRDEAGRNLLVCLVVAFLPAAVLGPLLDDTIERHLFRPGPVLAALLLGGLWMIWLDRRAGRNPEAPGLALESLDWRRALAIGLFQCVAMWPGTSRSMVTIAGGTVLGLRPREAAEFSFLLGLPTLGAACVYKLAKDLSGDGPSLFTVLGPGAVALGFAVAAVSAFVAVRWLVAFLTRHGLAAFGWYRLALAAVLGALIWTGAIEIAP